MNNNVVKVLIAMCGLIAGAGIMFEARETVQSLLLSEGKVHILAILAIGVATACHLTFIKYLAKGSVMTFMTFLSLGFMVYLTIFSTLYAASVRQGLATHLIAYAAVYMARFIRADLEGEGTPHPSSVQD